MYSLLVGNVYNIDNWKTQIKKGYLELCILTLIATRGKFYGLEIIDELRQLNLDIKEGTLYPLLNRMTKDELLKANWVTENTSGHPRKFYALSSAGKAVVKNMDEEFEDMNSLYKKIKKGNK